MAGHSISKPSVLFVLVAQSLRVAISPTRVPFCREVFADWVRVLVEDLGFGPDDPLFPKTRLAHDQNRLYTAAGLSRECWMSGDPIRVVFRAAFKAAGLPAPHPHILRDTIAQLGSGPAARPRSSRRGRRTWAMITF